MTPDASLMDPECPECCEPYSACQCTDAVPDLRPSGHDL
jgi:hypothetical protein